LVSPVKLGHFRPGALSGPDEFGQTDRAPI